MVENKSSNTNYEVLLVDDDGLPTSKLLAYLKDRGVSVQIAVSYLDAIAQCRRRTVDLVVIALPDGAGQRLLTRRLDELGIVYAYSAVLNRNTISRPHMNGS